MYMRRAGLLILFGTLALSGCAVRRYQAAPIVPSETASSLQERTLDDPGLRDFLRRNLGQTLTSWPLQTWDLGTLTLAALYFNPAMDSARARVAAAQAAIITAGAKPNPVLEFAAGVPSPYLLTLDLVLPIETAGKRGYRVQSARSVGQAAQFDLADTAWNVRSRVRAALLDYLLTSPTLDQLRAEEQIRTQQVDLLQQRFAVGEMARPDLNLARIELSKVRLTISNSEGQLQRAKAALAASIGIPVEGLQNTHFAWPRLESPPAIESFSPQEIQRAAVLNRLDVRRALAQYAAAEANLQLEVARQYPDVSIGPGYTYEERNSFFEPAVSLTLPLFNRNQGPIAEAEAARREAASAFVERQAQVLAESQQALALYKAAVKEFTEANETLQRLQGEQEQIVRSAVSVGEEDRITLNGIQLESLVASRARLDALNHALTALGQLEDAVQRPLAGDGFPMGPDSRPLTNVREESRR